MARTNIDLDDRLVKAGLRITGAKTKRELVHLALEQLVAKERRKKLLDLEGKVQWEGDLAELRKSRR